MDSFTLCESCVPPTIDAVYAVTNAKKPTQWGYALSNRCCSADAPVSEIQSFGLAMAISLQKGTLEKLDNFVVVCIGGFSVYSFLGENATIAHLFVVQRTSKEMF